MRRIVSIAVPILLVALAGCCPAPLVVPSVDSAQPGRVAPPVAPEAGDDGAAYRAVPRGG